MMKQLLGILLLLLSFPAIAQEATETIGPRETVETFFEGFHSRDSLMMKSVMHESLVMQTIHTRDGEAILQKGDAEKFLRSIVSIPLQTELEEKLHSFTIEIDGEMANVWTPYSLYVDGNFSHCGVNNFQLFKEGGKWKIFHLVDTRRRLGCEEMEGDPEKEVPNRIREQ